MSVCDVAWSKPSYIFVYIIIYNYQAVTTAAVEANTMSCKRSHFVVFLSPLLAAVEIVSSALGVLLGSLMP